MAGFMKSLCKIAVPVTLQSMLQASFSIVDQIMIGQLGETNISAVGLCGNFTLIFSVMIGAVSTVAGILIAQFMGGNDEKEAWSSLDVSLLCGMLIAALFLLASAALPAQILGLYTADVGIVETGSVYFRIVAWAYIPMAASSVLSAWMRCREHATIPFLASLGAVAVNTGLNYVLIFGKLGFAAMGIRGGSHCHIGFPAGESAVHPSGLCYLREEGRGQGGLVIAFPKDYPWKLPDDDTANPGQ